MGTNSNNKTIKWDMAVAITKNSSTMHLPATLSGAMFHNNNSSTGVCRCLNSLMEGTKEATSRRIMKLSDREFSRAAIQALLPTKVQSNFITHLVDAQTCNCSDMIKNRVFDTCLKLNEVRVYIRV